MNSVSKIKELYENKRDTSNIQNSNPNRKYSSSIKDKVSIFEKQIEELEQKRKNRNFFELSKKFGLQKYFDQNNPDSNNSVSTPKSNMTNLIKEIEDLCLDYERQIEIYKRRNSSIERKTENGQEQREYNGKSDSNIENLNACNNCYSTIIEIEEYKRKLKEKDGVIKKLTEENEELNKRFEDLNLHMDSMMNYLQAPLIEYPIISKENFSSNSNLESFKESYETNYLSLVSVNHLHQFSSNSNEKPPELIINNSKNIEEKINEIKEIPEDKPSHNQEVNILIVEILAESLFNEYLNENSLNISNVNKTLLSSNYLLTHMNTIFLNDSYKNISVSIYHEYIQNIFIHIYLSLLKIKLENSSNSNKSEISWMISEEEITNEVVLITVKEIFSIFYNLNHKRNIYLDKEKFFENALNKRSYSKAINVIISLKDEVKSIFLKKISNYEERIKEDIYQIVRICRNYIHAGKIVFRNRIIYDFWKLYSEIQFCNSLNSEWLFNPNNSDFPNNKYIHNQKLVFSPSPEVSGNIDNLLNVIKYHIQVIDSITILGSMRIEEQKEVVVFKNGIEIDIATSNEKIPINIILINVLCNSHLLNKIKSLTLNNLRFSDNDLFYLNSIIEFVKCLDVLNLNNNMLEDTGLRSLSDALKLNKTISSIFLANNKITHNGAFYLADLLLKNDSIRYIFLSGNNISGMGLQSLMNIIINGNKSIKYLDLSDNKLTNNDIIIISNLIIKNCPHFEMLDLSNNSLDSDSVNTLGIALSTNVYMKTISLNNIGLNEDSTPYFFQHLTEANIAEIFLDKNDLGEVGGVLFANVMKSNNSFKKISLKDTKLNSISLICISHALEIEMAKGFIKLESINLEDNEFDEHSIETLIKIFKTISKNKNNKSNLSYNQNDLRFPKISFSNKYISEKSKSLIKNSDFVGFAII